MVVQQEIQRLRGLGHSQRKVSKILGIHRNTVKGYWNKSVPLPESRAPDWANHLDWERIADEVEAKVPLTIIYEEQSQVHSLASYSSFCRQFKKHAIKDKITETTVRIYRPPGESVETDYSGGSIDIISPSTGEIIKTELFVGTMSNSSMMYAEFSFSQKLEDWIESHNRMFRFYGGVPKYEITDNLKSAVTKCDHFDPVINRTFLDMARHYSIAIDPADKRCPKHKPNVEKSVDVIQVDFFPRVRNRTFTSLRELNQCLWDYLEKKNRKVMKEKGVSRLELFEREKPLLKALPENPYELCHWKRAKIHPDCCFQFQKNFYSVPYAYAGKEVELKYNSRTVQAFSETDLVKTHVIAKGTGHFVIDEKDYPEKAIIDTNLYVQRALKEATRIGENTLLLVEKLLSMPRYPLKNLRKVQAVVSLQKKYSRTAVESAATDALKFDKFSYHFIKMCAKNYRTPKPKIIYAAPSRQKQLVCLQGGINE